MIFTQAVLGMVFLSHAAAAWAVPLAVFMGGAGVLRTRGLMSEGHPYQERFLC